MTFTAFKSGLYWVIRLFFEPTAICFPLGLQQKHVASEAAGSSLMFIEVPENSMWNTKITVKKNHIYTFDFVDS